MPQGINTGEILEALNDKMDRDGHNIESPSATVIETYSSGTEWYRVWSDGWCEQGGYYDSSNTTVVNVYKNTITWLKPFANMNYTVTAIGWSSDDSNYGSDGVFESSTTPRTTTTFTVDHESVVTKFCLRAEGYIS